jgi:hypothetical protein
MPIAYSGWPYLFAFVTTIIMARLAARMNR